MTIELIRAVFALAFVVGLMWLLGYLLRRYGSQLGFSPLMNRTGKDRRLQVLEVLPLDTRNKLVLIRHDDHEHLVVIGPQNALSLYQNKAENA